MTSKLSSGFLIVAMMLLPATARGIDSRTPPDLAKQATWKIPEPDQVREEVFRWLETARLDGPLRSELESRWRDKNLAREALLEEVAGILAAADPRARGLVEFCSRAPRDMHLPDVAWLDGPAVKAFERNNLKLIYGRWLAQHNRYDEAAAQLGELAPESVVDPATLLFYQGLLHHQTLERGDGLKVLSRLLENDRQIPRRYASLARLMQADLEKLKDESLDHIARRMHDVHRRLDLGHAGPKVRKVEDGVVKSLDKLIDEMEKQQQQAQAAAAAGQNLRSVTPAQQSRPMEGKGPGKVANKNVGDKSGWGNLPPRERQQALQQIGRDFPAHYRDLVEQYFRKLASQDEPDDR